MGWLGSYWYFIGCVIWIIDAVHCSSSRSISNHTTAISCFTDQDVCRDMAQNVAQNVAKSKAQDVAQNVAQKVTKGVS